MFLHDLSCQKENSCHDLIPNPRIIKNNKSVLNSAGSIKLDRFRKSEYSAVSQSLKCVEGNLELDQDYHICCYRSTYLKAKLQDSSETNIFVKNVKK